VSSPRGRVLGCAAVAVLAVTAPADARTVFTNTDEVRACLPLAGGDTLVGTGGGLVRVDPAGVARRVWTASDGLPGTRIDALVADGDRVWVGTDAGVAQLAGAIEHAVATRPVRDIVRWHDAVYLATWDGGVVQLGRRGGDAVAMQGGAAVLRARVSALAVAGGTLWAGTAAGLYRMRGDRLDHVDGPREVTALVADGDRLWIGAPDGVWLRDGGAPRGLGGGEVRHLAVVDGAVMAAGTDGLSTVDHGRVVAVAGAPRGFAQAIGAAHGAACTGGLDGLWLRPASPATPATAATPTAATWRHAPRASGPPSSDLSAIAADGPRLWAGTFDQGLATYDPERGWRRITAPGLDTRINAILVEPRPAGAHVWIATAEGITVLDGAGAIVSRLGKTDGLPSRSVLSLARLADGRIVAGTSVGAAFVGGGTVRRVGPRVPGDKGVGNVWAIAEAAGALWLGTTTGLYRGPATGWTTKDGADDAATLVEPSGPGPTTSSEPATTPERWRRLSVATGQLHDDWVTALAVRGDLLWAGTYHGGISRIDGDVATHLGGGWINPAGLTWDGDRLLAATMEGLVAGDGRTATWTTTPALPGRDVTGALRVGRTLWIATRRGLAAVE
jgi:hypothetical protein